MRTCKTSTWFSAGVIAVNACLVVAQDVATPKPPAPTWNTTQPRGATRSIDFTTSEGTWMSVSVTPDEKTLVFDHLDHIYSLPVTGGEAHVLTGDSGIALNFEPAVSPDGKSIAFISDRGGQNNLWVMDIDGSHPRAVDHDLDARDSLPQWTPDSRFILVRRFSTKSRGERKAEIWMFAATGGKGMKYVRNADRASEPAVSADGRYLYYSMDLPQTAEPAAGHVQLRQLDLKTGDVLDITRGVEGDHGLGDSRQSLGGGFAPKPSPDGRSLAYAKRLSAGIIQFKGHQLSPRTALFLRDLQTGSERLIADPIDHDSMGAVSAGSDWIGVVPAYSWSASSEHIYYGAGGKLHRADLATGKTTEIPFTVHVQRVISEQALAKIRIGDHPTFQPQFIRWPAVSPDTRRVVFQAAGQLWIQEVQGGRATRLLPASFTQPQFASAWSPDGKTIAFTSWDEEHQGHVWTASTDGGTPKQITTAAGEYQTPVWTPDGSQIVFLASSGATQRAQLLTDNEWYALMRVPSTGGTATRITYVNPAAGGLSLRRFLSQPSIGPNGRVVYPLVVMQGTEAVTEVRSVNLDGTDMQKLATLTNADEAVVSPDGKWLAFEEGDRMFLAALPAYGGGAPVAIQRTDGAWEARLINPLGGNFPHWVSSTLLSFGSASTLSFYDLAKQGVDKEQRIDLHVDLPTAEAKGSVLLKNARLITMRGDEVIEHGDIAVVDGRIQAIGPTGHVVAPAGAKVIDAHGTTIMPGLVDMHAHNHRSSAGLMPLHDFELASQLAYGVTTALDPSTWSQNVFPHSEMVRAGLSVGPRTFSSGDPLFGFDTSRSNALKTYDAMEAEVKRQKANGVVELKQYMTPQRAQRQWITEAARKLGLRVTAEGGDLFYDLGMIMDGQTGWEHPVQQEPLYDDATQFLGRAHAYYSPTLVVGGPGPFNDQYWRQETDLSTDEKLRSFLPQSKLEPHVRLRPVRPATDYTYPIIAQGAADIVAAGGNAAIGSHAQEYGVGVQWEIWMFASAMGPHQALETATLGGARMLGAQQDIGSLEAGKLADLLVLERNPLEDIRNSATIRWVMLGGVMRSGKNLDEVWPLQQPYGGFYWQHDPSRLNDVKVVK